MTAPANDLEPRILNQVVRALRPTNRYNPVLSPVYDKSWNPNLGKSLRIIRPEALPLVFATLQLSEGSTRADSSSEANSLVEHFPVQGFLSVD